MAGACRCNNGDKETSCETGTMLKLLDAGRGDRKTRRRVTTALTEKGAGAGGRIILSGTGLRREDV